MKKKSLTKYWDDKSNYYVQWTDDLGNTYKKNGVLESKYEKSIIAFLKDRIKLSKASIAIDESYIKLLQEKLK